MYQTMELGPIMNTPAPNFELPNHYRIPTSLDMLLYGRGLLLACIGEIWQPANVRRILWLQRHLIKFNTLDISIALLAVDQPHTLYGFQVSNPLPTMFPLLADVDGAVHKAYRMDRHPGVVLIDENFVMRSKWLLDDDEVWPKLSEIAHAVNAMSPAAV